MRSYLVQFCYSILTLPIFFFLPTTYSIKIWASPGDLPTAIPVNCRNALSQNISCSPDLVSARSIAAGRSLDVATLGSYCTTDCYNSLQAFKTAVNASCGNAQYKMFVNSTLQQSGISIADPLAWAYSVACIKDNIGFCLPALYNGTKAACSDCSYKYGAAMLSSDYGRTKLQPKAFSSLLSSCSVPATKYPYTYTSSTPTASATATATPAPAKNCTDTPYTVSASDTCKSISQAKSIAIDRLITANNLDYNCSLLTSGSKLCLGPKCTLHEVAKNETCQSISKGKQYTSVQLISWNPTIHANCDNLDSMIGRSICVTPPGSLTYDATPLNITKLASMSSMFPGPYYTTGSIAVAPPNITTKWYNTQTTFLPPSTKTITANLTAASLIAARTPYCPFTSEDILDGRSEADLPDNCQALLEPYCYPDPNAPVPKSTVFPASCTPPPLRDAATSTTAAVTSSSSNKASASASPTPSNTKPSPLQPSTIATCKQYYQVLSGDFCHAIAQKFSITLDQFNLWNPSVGTDCKGLFLGYYVCVKA